MSRSSRFLGQGLAAISAKLLLCLSVVFALTALMVGQETTGGIKGYVKDKSGAVISKAQVELTSTALIVPKKAETDGGGYFYFQQLPPGNYTLTVIAPNFRTYKQTAIPLSVGQLPSLDVSLEVGTVGEVVEVSGKAPIVDVTTSKVAVEISQEMIDNLPKGRSYQSLIPFAPGARQEPLQSSRVDRLRQNGFQIDGASDSENTYLVEGLDTSNIQNGGIKQNVVFEFVDQVQVKTSGTEAEFGGAMGGVVNVIQKRGSNNWHGSLVTYYRSSAFDANDQCATTPQPTLSESVVPAAQQLKCGLRYNPATAFSGSTNGGTRTDQASFYYLQKQDNYKTLESGYEVGGPLLKNKLWLFSSYIPSIDRITRQTVSTFATNAGLHTYTRSDTTHNMLNRLDFQPFQQLHLYAGWQYGYHRIAGQLPTYPDSLNGQASPVASQDPTTFRSDTGSVNPSNILNFGGDWTPTSRMVVAVRYGYFYYNTEDRGLPVGIRDTFSQDLVVGTTTSPLNNAVLIPNASSAGAGFAHPTGFANMSNNLTTLFDIFSRKAFNTDVSYSVSKFGTHNFKVGYGFNHLYNNVFQGTNTALVQMAWGQVYPTVTALGAQNCIAINADNLANYGGQSPAGKCTGFAGYFTIRDGVETNGKASSYNHGIYGQDAWTVGHGLTLNLGLRFDKEYLPPYSPGNPSITFGFTQKVAPRIGGAYDVLHNGKLKVFASYGKFYDIMKYSLPRGSFGGDYWHDCIYAMDTLDYTAIQPTSPGGHGCGPGNGPSAGVTVGRFIENQDWRAPAGNPDDPGVDPNVKPGSQHEYVFGTDWAISSKMGFEVRYARKRLDNAIDDMSVDDSVYYIGNPGPSTYSDLLHRPLPAMNTPQNPHGFDNPLCPDCPASPKAIRRYDGIESRLTFHGSKLFGQITYTYSRLYGNYSGLTDTDVTDASGGRHNANNNRTFDLPEMQFTTSGAVVDGPLGTDRPNVVTLNGFYPLRWKGMETTLGLTQNIGQGSPKSTCIAVIDSTSSCQYIGQRGTWADITRDPATGDLVLGNVDTSARMPWYTQTDLNLSHAFHVSKTNEAMKLAFELNVSNLLNQRAVLSYNPNPLAQGNEFLQQTGAGAVPLLNMMTGYDPLAAANAAGLVLNSQYGKPWIFQGSRNMRMAVRFTF